MGFGGRRMNKRFSQMLLVKYTADKKTECDIEEIAFQQNLTDLLLSRCVGKQK
jgi:hypothetical protein